MAQSQALAGVSIRSCSGSEAKQCLVHEEHVHQFAVVFLIMAASFAVLPSLQLTEKEGAVLQHCDGLVSGSRSTCVHRVPHYK